MEAMELVTVEADPFNAEAPLPALADALTRPPLFYVRSHGTLPALDASTWRLSVDGEVERPLKLSLAELQRLPEKTIAVTLECAGNGRAAMARRAEGAQWGFGATSTARFTGTLLASVLNRAGLSPQAVAVLLAGADEGEVTPGRIEPFVRSLPIQVARHPDTLLAWAMNGEPLSREHGFPLRVVVPGWYGMAAVKWLVRVAGLRRPYHGYYQAERYVYSTGEDGADGQPVSCMRVRAIIAAPAEGARLPRRQVTVAGAAWSGEAEVRSVEVSLDGGATWAAAELDRALSPYAARPWRYAWVPDGPGAYTILARALDEAGNVQPLAPLWNRWGYGNNVAQRVQVTVED